MANFLALPLRTRLHSEEWYVAPTSLKVGKDMVWRHHYSRSASPSAVYLFGLMLKNDFNVWGVSWWIPAPKATVDSYNPGGYSTTLVLHRLVVHPLVPTNGASFLLGRSIRAIVKDGRYELLVTYADTWRGHTGQIYKATNWEYRGLSEPTQVWTTEGGQLIGRRGQRYGKGKNRLNSDLIAMGCTFQGKYAKHVYTMKLKLKESKQLELFQVTA
jgi:hypothetical protein